MTKKFVNLDNTKGRPDNVYSSVISKIQNDGVCPFCREQLNKYHKNPILDEGKHWLVTDSMYPYKGTAHHILLIHKEHISTISEVSPSAWKELHNLISTTIKKRGISGGTFFIRFGDTRYTGASVSHLHAHLVSSKPDDPSYSPLMARVG